MKSNIFTLRNKRDWMFWLFTLMLFLQLIGGAMYIIIMTVIVMLLLGYGIRKYIDSTSIAIFLFSFSYVGIEYLRGFNSELPHIYFMGLMPFFFYIYGKFLVDKELDEMAIIKRLLIIIIALGGYVYITTFKEVFIEGRVLLTVRIFGSEEEDEGISATLIGSLISLGFVGLPVALYSKLSKTLKLLYFGAFFFSLLTSVHLLNRSGVLIAFTSVLITTLVYRRSNPSKVVLLVFLFIVVFFLLMSSSIGMDIINAYNARGFDASKEEDRIPRWIAAINNIPGHLIGWRDVRGDSSVHNMWLDVAMVSGIIPFIFLLLVTITGIKNMLKLVRLRKNDINLILLSMNVSFFITEMVEPIALGLPMLLLLNLFVYGVQKQYYKKLYIIRR